MNVCQCQMKVKGKGNMYVQLDAHAGTEAGDRDETGDETGAETGGDGGAKEIWAKVGVYSYI